MPTCTFGRQRDTRAIPPCPAAVAGAAPAQHASLTRQGGGILLFRHAQHSWVPSPLKKGGRPAGSLAWASSGSTASTGTTLVSRGDLLARWGEGSNIIPILPTKQKMKFYSHMVIPSSQILDITAIQPLVFKCVIEPFFPRFAADFLLQHRSNGVRCYVLVSFQDCSPLFSLRLVRDGWGLASSHWALRNILQ